jgi:hypothetical protein
MTGSAESVAERSKLQRRNHDRPIERASSKLRHDCRCIRSLALDVAPMNRQQTQDRITEADYIIYIDHRPEQVADSQDVKFEPIMALTGIFWGCIFGACLWIALYYLAEVIR